MRLSLWTFKTKPLILFPPVGVQKGEPQICTVLSPARNSRRFPFHTLPNPFVHCSVFSTKSRSSARGGGVQPAGWPGPCALRPARRAGTRGGRGGRRGSGSPVHRGAHRQAQHDASAMRGQLRTHKGPGLGCASTGGTWKILSRTTPRRKCRTSGQN